MELDELGTHVMIRVNVIDAKARDTVSDNATKICCEFPTIKRLGAVLWSRSILAQLRLQLVKTAAPAPALAL